MKSTVASEGVNARVT